MYGIKNGPAVAGQRVAFSSIVHCSLLIINSLAPPEK
jgi:hypothetical protein